jgi:molybdopterin/thiamine biosynthesis adenylyltransferase
MDPYAIPNPRRDQLMPPLSGKRVTVVGLGGGAPIPIELLRCGVSGFDLVDHDILEIGNAVRHPCPRKYFGLPKVEAVKAHMQELSGTDTDIHTHRLDVFEHRPKMMEIIGNSDLLVVATDTESSRHYLNEIAVDTKTPAVFVGMFENGSGGEIFAALPDQACYTCLAEHLGRKEFLTEYRASVKKGDCSSARDTLAMPGLGIDQGLLALIAARKSVDILLLGTQHSLPSVGKNWIVFSTFGIPKILESSLTSMQYDPVRHPGCFACGN